MKWPWSPEEAKEITTHEHAWGAWGEPIKCVMAPVLQGGWDIVHSVEEASKRFLLISGYIQYQKCRTCNRMREGVVGRGDNKETKMAVGQ